MGLIRESFADEFVWIDGVESREPETSPAIDVDALRDELRLAPLTGEARQRVRRGCEAAAKPLREYRRFQRRRAAYAAARLERCVQLTRVRPSRRVSCRPAHLGAAARCELFDLHLPWPVTPGSTIMDTDGEPMRLPDPRRPGSFWRMRLRFPEELAAAACPVTPRLPLPLPSTPLCAPARAILYAAFHDEAIKAARPMAWGLSSEAAELVRRTRSQLRCVPQSDLGNLRRVLDEETVLLGRDGQAQHDLKEALRVDDEEDTRPANQSALSEPERKVLWALDSNNAQTGGPPMKDAELQTYIDRGHTSICRATRFLRSRGLVESVRGKRGGYVLTPKGVDWVRENPKPSKRESR
jgi:hypothetical protein